MELIKEKFIEIMTELIIKQVIKFFITNHYTKKYLNYIKSILELHFKF